MDVLNRSTPWTLGREASLGLLFAGITFYDGTGFLVRASSGVRSAAELDGATVCVLPGTSTELAVADYVRQRGMRFTPILIDSANELRAAFLAGRRDAYSTDTSALAAFRYGEGERAKELALLPEVISKEPLGPVVRKGDGKWFDIVRWANFAALAAKELGLTSATVDAALTSEVPEVRRLLGAEGDLGKSLGLDNRWAFNVVKQVGNYREVWDRTIGPLGIPRRLNQLWSKGRLHYPPPVR